MSQSEQITTINKYMNTANPRTIDALKTQIEWKEYFNCLTWFDKHANINVLMAANKYRNDFNDSNTSFSGPTYLTIKQGSVGENVVQWQKILGFSGPAADGKFGPKTKAATVEWQRNHGLTPDGIVGPLTWTKALSGGVNKFEPIAHVPAKSTGAGTIPFKVPPSAVYKIPTTSPKTTTTNTGIKYPPNTLHVGSRGAEVVSWQKVVGAKPDGIFGVNTETANREWQRKHNLTVTGFVTASDKAAATATPKMPPYIPPIVTPVINAATMVPTKVIEVVKEMPLWQKIAGGIVTSAAVFFGYKAYSKPTPKTQRSFKTQRSRV